jgi:hypothetical protein
MQLNLPILDQVRDSQNILVAGAGGGFDVYAGLPIYFALRALGKTVHLANYSFSDYLFSSIISNAEVLDGDLVFGLSGSLRRTGDLPIAAPEAVLAQWFEQIRGEKTTIWLFKNAGVVPVRKAYQSLVKHLGIDALILVDGGVDSLMCGDETWPGTLIEDAISLAAVEPLDVPIKILSCVGFGTEVEEGLCHHHALENIAALAKIGAFLGSCALTPQMEVFQLYEAAGRYVWEMPPHARSHISTRIIPAVHGEFGDHYMYPENRDDTLFISPLMSLYWFFDATSVIKRSLLIPLSQNSQTVRDAFARYGVHRARMSLRPRKPIPY